MPLHNACDHSAVTDDNGFARAEDSSRQSDALYHHDDAEDASAIQQSSPSSFSSPFAGSPQRYLDRYMYVFLCMFVCIDLLYICMHLS